MHGQHKLSNEGYRTRDGHIIEWLGRFAAAKESHIDVLSRPEPVVLGALRRIRGSVAAGTVPVQTLTWRPPKFDRKRWWVQSARAYPKVAAFGGAPAVAWNPFIAAAPTDRNPFCGDRTVVLDLLDDWTVHQGFSSIWRDVENAYLRAFEVSSAVFVNSEGTFELAQRLGRSDAVLMTNGVDPERFDFEPNAHGPLTIGYVGKIGHRLNAQLLSDVCGAFPKLRFVFAGPFLDLHDKYRALLERFPNVELLGDVHYEDVPALMATFDLGWVPHAVGEGEVGGDIIKTYEYRATGLQVLTTPVIGAGRVLTEGVNIVSAQEQVAWLHEATRGRERLDRIPADIPDHLTWRHKAGYIAQALGVKITP
ncbi:MAG: glycosyltransferase [Steroidobacteraceae bacterium]